MKRFTNIRRVNQANHWGPRLILAAVVVVFAWLLVAAVPGCSKPEPIDPALMTSCPDCKRQVSKRADACPQCGHSFRFDREEEAAAVAELQRQAAQDLADKQAAEDARKLEIRRQAREAERLKIEAAKQEKAKADVDAKVIVVGMGGKVVEDSDYRLVSIDLAGCNIDPLRLKKIEWAKLPKLRMLDLQGTTVGDDEVQFLFEADSLELVNLIGTKTTYFTWGRMNLLRSGVRLLHSE